MKVSDLLDAARARTGLEDFGDKSFCEGLERLVDAINRENEPNEHGRSAGPEMLIAQLAGSRSSIAIESIPRSKTNR